MSSRAHKTSSQEFRDSLREIRDAGPFVGKLSRKAYREKYGDAEFFDDEIPFGNERSSEHMAKLPSAELQSLDTMLERHGVAKILRSLRELCDSRGGHEAPDTFEAVPESDEWRGQGDELEQLLLKLASRVKA
jgi:hypothetical protein